MCSGNILVMEYPLYDYLDIFTLIGPAPAIDRLGIKPYQWGTECLSGDVNAGDATSFPMAIGMVTTCPLL